MSYEPSPQGPVSLASHLETLAPKDGSRAELFGSVLPAIIDAVGEIAKALQKAHRVSLAGTANTFGDDQLNVDVAAEDILRRTFASRCPSVVTASSEEDPVEKPVDHTSGSSGAGSGNGPVVGNTERYTVAFDPLDGSSIIAPNWTVGTILGIWDGATAVGRNPDDGQVAAVLGVYGPRTTALVAVRIPGTTTSPSCFEVALDAGGGAEVLRSDVRLSAPPFKTRYFAPANLRAAAQDERYMGLVSGYIQQGYTLRYSGGLVPDVVHALVKGHGVYVSPVTAQSRAKLRRLYELYPVALIFEAAGGRAVDPADGGRILDVVLRGTDERAGLVCGTAEEVDKVREALLA
ncbi:sedoheptulose-1,7-bisphosphatase [Diaporthe helianthi]|uniref:Sedoheptulose-1,7-bisphosphatase n=1 Tax=Diaporthe helianthi TaxID=158607 RepID=A0A2P5I2J9_DIAHE|nr:sedoheptulose-1,7-bisphosphatase [Diaporthe helianthi]